MANEGAHNASTTVLLALPCHDQSFNHGAPSPCRWRIEADVAWCATHGGVDDGMIHPPADHETPGREATGGAHPDGTGS